MTIATATITGSFVGPDLTGDKVMSATYEAYADGSAVTYTGLGVIGGRRRIDIQDDGTATVTIPKIPQAGLLPAVGVFWLVRIHLRGRTLQYFFTLTADTTWDAVLTPANAATVPTLLGDVITARDAALAAVAAVKTGTWQPATAYVASQTVQAPDGSLIKSSSSRTSGATFDATEQTFWTPVSTTAATFERVALDAKYALIGSSPAASSLAVNVKHPTYGATGNGSTDDTTAIAAALAAAKAAGRTLYFPAGTYKITSTQTVDWDYSTVIGDGANSILNFVGCGLKVDGSVSYRLRTTLRDLRLTRTGAAGPALLLQGASGSTGVARFTIDNVDVKGSTGDGMESAGCYIGTVLGSYFRECAGRGVYLHDATNHTNAVTFHGGEIQQNAGIGVELNNVGGISFHGTCIEGNTTGGAKVNAAVGVGFYGTYWEANGVHDILVGDTTTVSGFVVSGSYFAESSLGKTDSILLNRATGVDIRGNGWQSYGVNSPVNVNEASAGAVVGAAPELENFRNGTAPGLVNIVAGTKFNTTVAGQNISAPIVKHLKASTTLNFGSIASGAAQDLTLTVTGAVVGDDATVHTSGALEAGTVIYAWVSATDTVTVRTTNATAAAIDPGARTYRVHVWN